MSTTITDAVSAASTRQQLNAEFARRWGAGETLAAIGAAYGITSSNVHKRIVESGERPAALAAREARKTERDAALRSTREHPVLLHPMPPRAAPAAALIAVLAAWLRAGGSGKAADWDSERYRRSTIGSAQYAVRFGSWAAALAAAEGDETFIPAPTKDGYIAAEQALAAVVRFLREVGVHGTQADYFAWSPGRSVPSANTVGNRLGCWTSAKRQALEVLAAENNTRERESA